MLPPWSRNRFVVIGAALILAIAAGDWLIVSMEREASFAAYETAGSNLTRGMNAQTSRMLGTVDTVLRDIPAALAIGGIATPDLIKAAMRAGASSDLLADRQKRLPGVDTLTLVDAGGLVANSSRGGLPDGTDVSGSEFFVRLSVNADLRLGVDADAVPFVSAPVRDAASGEWSSFIARRMTDSHDNFAGVVLARLALDDLEDFYSVAMPPHRVVTVMRSDGTILVQYPHRVERTGQKAPGFASRAPLPSACVAYHGPDLVDGAPVVAVVCGMRGMPLFIETSATEAEALAGWSRERMCLVLGGVLTSVGVVLLLRIFAAQVHLLEVSELSIAAKKLQAETAHRQLDVALSNIAQGVCFFDGDHRLIVANRRYQEIYGLPPDAIRPGVTLAESVGYCCAAIGICNYESAEYLMSLVAIARAGRPNHSVIELKDGRTVAIQTQPMADGGWVATHEDITERRRAEEIIEFLARHDALTGLANRSLLQERMRQALVDSARGDQFAILFLDLDRFKEVNDMLGHNVGDELLRNVATRLLETVRNGDTIARIGGDEFVVLQTGISAPEDAARLARRIIKSVGEPYRIGEDEVVVGVSVGIDLSGHEPRSADGLLNNADVALYMAKVQRRGTFRFFEPDMVSQVNLHRRRPPPRYSVIC
ncbi:MAG: diguanylate cyclase [Roseiarcus sp.]|jgi:diguanylate cyclase (GGDEF)-like protein